MNLELARLALTDVEAALVRVKGALAETPSSSGTLIKPEDNLQEAINRAQPGEVLTLVPGARYVTGELQLPAKEGLVTLRSAANLPERRITPGDAHLLPILASGNIGPVINGTNAAHWEFDGIQFESTATGHGEIIVLENAQSITLDRVLIVAGPEGQKRAIRGNGRGITLGWSHIANIIRTGQDSQAFCAWEGAGPYYIIDNYLEASGENIMFGGSDNLGGESTNPSDIYIEQNDIVKRPEWRANPGTVKNLLEFKNATRAIVRGNRFANNWTDAQAGWSILLTPKNQDGRAPWTTVKDILIEENVITGVERGFNISGRDYRHVTRPMSGIVIRKNVMEVQAQAMQFATEIADLTVEDNVFENGWNIATIYTGQIREVELQPVRDAAYAVQRLAFNRNVARHNEYGIIGGGIGTAALVYNNISDYVFTDNRFVGLPDDPRKKYPESTRNITEADLQAAKAALLAEIGR
jgi:hypothetical protein